MSEGNLTAYLVMDGLRDRIVKNQEYIKELEQRLNLASDYFYSHCIACENYPNKECFGCSFLTIIKLLRIEEVIFSASALERRGG